MKKRFLPLLFSLAFAYLLLEAGTCLLMRHDYLRGDLPSFSFRKIFTKFWKEIPSEFVIWHGSNVVYRHRKSCFDVEYHSNREGMRDKERPRNSDRARALLIGDSFVEGYGVADGNRVSDLLETASGKEVLNFGMAGYVGPTHYYVLYQSLARNFSHDELILGILPSNDFYDDDYESRKSEGKVRPFWVGVDPNYQMVYSPGKKKSAGRLESTLYSFLREFSYSFNAWMNLRALRAVPLPVATSHKLPSKFYDFTEAEYRRMLYSLQKIREAAADKKFGLFLIPVMEDLQRYDVSGKSPLAEKLESWGRKNDVKVLDLLPWMHDQDREWSKYFYSCDNHWNSYGNQIAFEYLKTKIPQTARNK